MRNNGRKIEIFSWIAFILMLGTSLILAFSLGFQASQKSYSYWGNSEPKQQFHPELFFPFFLGGPFLSVAVLLFGTGFGKIVTFAEEGLAQGISIKVLASQEEVTQSPNKSEDNADWSW